MPKLLQEFDIIVDTFAIAGNSTLGLEGMSTGLAVVDYRHWSNLQERMDELSDVNQVKQEYEIESLWSKHDVRVVGKQLSSIAFLSILKFARNTKILMAFQSKPLYMSFS
jgi:hypothetical protein